MIRWMTFSGALLLLPVVLPAVMTAQTSSDPNPISAALVQQYEPVRDYVLKAAQEMPAADYGYRPSPKVRTFGEIVGHVADAEYGFCSGIKGEANPHTGSAEKLPTKADLVKTLAAAFSYCDAAYHSASDATMNDQVMMFGEHRTRLYVMVANIGHTNEHYGNMVVYLRSRGLVPPSSMAK